MKMQKQDVPIMYTADVHEENNRLWANFVKFPEAFTEADNEKDLYDNLINLLKTHVSGLHSLNEPIPIPLNNAEKKLTGNFHMKIPLNLKKLTENA